MVNKINRRNFCISLALATSGLLTTDLLLMSSANASENISNNEATIKENDEKYLVFVPYTRAREGGKQEVILYSGNFYQLNIPSRVKDNQIITIEAKDAGQNGNDLSFTIYTLYDLQTRIADKIYEEIDKTNFISQATKTKCKAVYEQIEDCKFIEDLEALELLDYIISTSKLDDNIRQKYELASNNSRLLGIAQVIENSLEKSKLAKDKKRMIRGTFESVKAGQPVADFKILTELDTIVLNSNLSDSLKQTYVLGSAVSRGLTVDYLIVDKINKDQKLTTEEKEKYLSVYKEVRDGKSSSDVATLKQLDDYILAKGNLSLNVQVVYHEARQKNVDKTQEIEDNIYQLENQRDEFQDLLEKAEKNGRKIVPEATKLLTQLGAEAGTGVSISSLSGAAATNATLAWLGGGSVASGGFGMLGGLAVVTGGAALIGAAGIISLALVSQMDGEDKKNLGIAVGGGTIIGAAALLTAWTAASALGVAGSLSGAAAISTMIASLGGLSVMTGGTALVASAAAYLIWNFLKSNKKREQGILEQLETRIYTLTQEPKAESFANFIISNISEKYNNQKYSTFYGEGFIAPYLPLEKLANSLKTWVNINANEKVIALIDTSINNDAKEGIMFTDQRIIWRYKANNHFLAYQELNNAFHQEVSKMINQDNSRHILEDVVNLAQVLSDYKEQQEFILFLEKLSQKYVEITKV